MLDANRKRNGFSRKKQTSGRHFTIPASEMSLCVTLVNDILNCGVGCHTTTLRVYDFQRKRSKWVKTLREKSIYPKSGETVERERTFPPKQALHSEPQAVTGATPAARRGARGIAFWGALSPCRDFTNSASLQTVGWSKRSPRLSSV